MGSGGSALTPLGSGSPRAAKMVAYQNRPVFWWRMFVECVLLMVVNVFPPAPIHVDQGFVNERFPRVSPDFEPCLVEMVQQCPQILLSEPAAEVSRFRRIGWLRLPDTVIRQREGSSNGFGKSVLRAAAFQATSP